MPVAMTLHTLENNRAVINLELSADVAVRTAEAIRHLLAFGGQEVEWLDEEGEQILSVKGLNTPSGTLQHFTLEIVA